MSNLIPHPRKLPTNGTFASLLSAGWSSKRIAERYGTDPATVRQMKVQRGLTVFDRGDFMLLSEVAALLSVSPDSLRSYVRRGVLASRWHGRRRGMNAAQVEQARTFYATRDPQRVEAMKAAAARRWP